MKKKKVVLLERLCLNKARCVVLVLTFHTTCCSQVSIGLDRGDGRTSRPTVRLTLVSVSRNQQPRGLEAITLQEF